MDTSRKSTYIIAAISLFIIALAVYFLFIYQKSPEKLKAEEKGGIVESIEKIDIESRPFVTLTPTSDGAEIIISIENMGFFDKIEYELTYQADNPQTAGNKIQRGSVETDVDTTQPKYKKSLLLGTASRGTRSPDTGVEDGVLSLHLFKGDTEYLSETNWDRFQVGATKSTISDASGKFSFDVPNLGKSYWMIVVDTVGVPPNAEFKIENTVLPVFGTFSIAPAFTKGANVSIIVNDKISDPKLYSYSTQEASWQKLESTFSNGSINSTVDSFATFVVVSSAQ